MSDIVDRLPQLITTPILIGVAAPFVLPAIPAGIVAGLTAITFAPQDLAQYYRQIHESFLLMNAAVAKVKYEKCWDPEATGQWRAFRDSWIRFYSSGPSKWWILSGDKAAADGFAKGLVWWHDAIARACGQAATVPVQAPISNPFFLQPLPAADPDVVAAAQLKLDAEELKKRIDDLGLTPIPWGWIGVFAAGAVGLLLWSNSK